MPESVSATDPAPVAPVAPVALVTGGSRGIGLGICRALAREGFDIAFNGRRPHDEVAEVVEALESLGASVLYCRADVASAEDRAAMLEAVINRFGRIDTLVNNAGVAPAVRADILEEGADETGFERLININLKGPYFLTQAVARWMVNHREEDQPSPSLPGPARRRCILFIGSISATVASVNRGDYCLSKAGVAMAARLWAARLGEYGIDVFEVRPGITATDMTSGVKEKYDRLIAEGLTVQPRWGTPEDMGSAVAVLATGRVPYATGQVLHVDGGLTLPRL